MKGSKEESEMIASPSYEVKEEYIKDRIKFISEYTEVDDNILYIEKSPVLLSTTQKSDKCYNDDLSSNNSLSLDNNIAKEENNTICTIRIVEPSNYKTSTNVINNNNNTTSRSKFRFMFIFILAIGILLVASLMIYVIGSQRIKTSNITTNYTVNNTLEDIVYDNKIIHETNTFDISDTNNYNNKRQYQKMSLNNDKNSLEIFSIKDDLDVLYISVRGGYSKDIVYHEVSGFIADYISMRNDKIIKGQSLPEELRFIISSKDTSIENGIKQFLDTILELVDINTQNISIIKDVVSYRNKNIEENVYLNTLAFSRSDPCSQFSRANSRMLISIIKGNVEQVHKFKLFIIDYIKKTFNVSNIVAIGNTNKSGTNISEYFLNNISNVINLISNVNTVDDIASIKYTTNKNCPTYSNISNLDNFSYIKQIDSLKYNIIGSNLQNSTAIVWYVAAFT